LGRTIALAMAKEEAKVATTSRKRKVKYPTASCGALREREPPCPKSRTGPLSSPQQAEGYPAEIFMNRV